MAARLSSLHTSFVRKLITNTEAEKSNIYGRRNKRFGEGKKANFDVVQRRVKPIPNDENPASEVETSGALEAKPLAPKTAYPAVL
jgi:hypothetical protein